jgi:hypothetical protein
LPDFTADFLTISFRDCVSYIDEFFSIKISAEQIGKHLYIV